MRGELGEKMKKGLTLVEVLLAVAILSVGLVVLLTATSRCLAVMKVAKNYQTAQWTLGRGELDHPFAATNYIEDLEVEPFTYPNGFTFSRVVEDDDDEDGLFVARTRASWLSRERELYEEVVQYVFLLEED